MSEGGSPGIVAEVRDGRRSWFGTAGVADTDTGRQRKPQEQYRIGSSAKTFTATVVLQLVAEHKLSLDDTVEKWLPGVVHGHGHDGSKISVRRLLNHTSGIYNYAMDPALNRK
ncbi:alkaline D-peptidase [Streptomyces sp. NBRC 110611]|nr:alkaline D-peptidase [Streptomyces sp. NBRC 110611]